MNIFPKNVPDKLDFPFILKELEHLCVGSLGRQLLFRHTFISDREELQRQLSYVKEFKEIIVNDKQLPQYGFDEMPFLSKLHIENYYLDTRELLSLFHTLSSVLEVARYFSNKSRQALYPYLTNMIGRYNFEFAIVEQIAAVLDIDKEQIKEHATPELSKIRKQIREQIQEINAVFRRVIQEYKQNNILAETEETIRDGRRVLSVRSEFKRTIKGLIVDESENGNITYIEPEQTVFLNNKLTELYLDERREIQKILIDLTNKIRPHKENIESFQVLMAELDVIRSKAYFAVNYNCNMPLLSKDRKLYLRDFIHPVLYHHHQKAKKPIVENSILLDEKNRILVISGPNAGGKSIVLKSVGLLQLMLQFGMLIPAKENSEMSLFDNLFVDIGDEQSIENDLSTYSSHLSNMQYFTSKANSSTLVLIDEMGMGTDPALGGPMAEAVLECLHQKSVLGVVTTHFNNLKIYATETSNMQSGAMAFDIKNLKPLFQLQVGQPGSSFTFEIALKSGLQESIVKKAELMVGDKKVLDDVLGDIQVERQYIKGLRKNVQVKEAQLDGLTKSYEQLNKELEKEKKRLLKQFESRLLERFNEESRNLENEMRAWKEEKADKDKFLKTRHYIDKNRNEIEQKLDDQSQVVVPSGLSEITVGSRVRLDEGSEVGVVAELKNKMAVIAFGNIQTKVNIQHLVHIASAPKVDLSPVKSFASKIIIEKSQFDYNLDIRGLMKDEALIALDNFMDRAVMYGIHQLKIIHGRGTGALRQAVQFYLKGYPHVKSFHYESDQFGGDGITIVEMK